MSKNCFINGNVEREYRKDLATLVSVYGIRRKYESMLVRCGNKSGIHPAYEDVHCDFIDWNEFCTWFYDEQDSYRPFYLGKYQKSYEYQLDKDLIGGLLGLRIYSPKTCVFLPKYLNTMLETNAGQRRDLPIGVTMGRVLGDTQTYSVYTTVFGKNSHILIDRSAADIHTAHMEYKLCKEYLIRRNAEEFYKRGLITPLVYYALLSYIVKDDTGKAIVDRNKAGIIYRKLKDRGTIQKLEDRFQEFTIPELDKMVTFVHTYSMRDIHDIFGPYERSILFKYYYEGVKPTEEEYNGVFKRRLNDMTNGNFTVPKFSDYDFSKMRK